MSPFSFPSANGSSLPLSAGIIGAVKWCFGGKIDSIKLETLASVRLYHKLQQLPFYRENH